MKTKVLIVPIEVIYGLQFKLLDELTDATFDQVKAKADILREVRQAGKTGEVEWTE